MREKFYENMLIFPQFLNWKKISKYQVMLDIIQQGLKLKIEDEHCYKYSFWNTQKQRKKQPL